MDPVAVLPLCPKYARIPAVPLFAPRAKPDNGALCPEAPLGTWYELAALLIFLGPRVDGDGVPQIRPRWQIQAHIVSQGELAVLGQQRHSCRRELFGE